MNPKTLFLIRHGESTWNAAYRHDGIDPLHFDPPLTPKGEEQALRVRSEMLQTPVDLVITSPLTRALQTTRIAFADHPSRPEIHVSALHRERCENSGDIGRKLAEIRAEFPALHFHEFPEVWWHMEGEPDDRGICVEPLEVALARIDQFKAMLIARPERRIAVVGHGTLFHHWIGVHMANGQVEQVQLAPAEGLV